MHQISAKTIVVAANPFGILTGLYQVNQFKIAAPKSTPAKADLVAIIDRSGSMWNDIESVKSGLNKLLGIHEVLGGKRGGVDLSMSLISYSGSGDCVQHFAHVDMAVATQDKNVAQQIGSLRPSGLTGMSQAVRMAQKLHRPGRILYTVLMSDGYCNDPGVRSEQDGTMKAAQDIVTAGGIVSTLCYGDYADFAFLNQVAVTGKGVCLRAGSAKDFYVAMETGAKAAANLQAQAIRLGAEGADMVVCVDPQNRTILSAVGGADLVLSGLPSKDAVAYRYVKDSGSAHLSVAQKDNGLAGLLAARVMLDHGDVANAKEFVIGSRVQEARKLWRALTSAEQRDLTASLDSAIFGDGEPTIVSDLAVIPSGPSILDVLAVMDEYGPETFQVHMPSLTGNYQRRTVGRLNGTREADGTFTPFRYGLVPVKGDWANVTGIIISRTSPNVSIQTTMAAKLTDLRTKKSVGKIGPVSIAGKLKMIRSYTIIVDGAVMTPTAKFKINDRRAREAMTALGVAVDPKTWEAEIDFSKMAVVAKEPSDCLPSSAAVDRMLRAAALAKLLASVKPEGESAEYDAGMVAKLKEYGLTPSLNFSPPTTAPYKDLKDALSNGEIDVRVGYDVYVGTEKLPTLAKGLYSGNEFLARRFTAKVGGKDPDKMTGALLLDGATFAVKLLTGSTKLGAADEAAFLVNCGALGVKESGAADALSDALLFAYNNKAQAKAAADVIAKVRTGKMERATAIGELDAIRRQIDGAIERFWAAHISPVVLYTGGTGSLPASIQAKQVDATVINGAIPKAMKAEGAFYLTQGGLLVSIVARTEYVPTAKTAKRPVSNGKTASHIAA